MHYVGGPLELTVDHLAALPVEDVHNQHDFTSDTIRWTASGRSALRIILTQWREILADGWMLLPDYLCWEAILPVLEGTNFRCAPIDDRFAMEASSLERCLSDPDLRAILLVDYFGLCDLVSQIEQIKSKRPDILVVVDAVQSFSLLTELPCAFDRYAGADAIFASPRKTLPLPDGGLLLMREDTPQLPPCTKNSVERAALYLAAGTLRKAVVDGLLDNAASLIAETLYVDMYKRHSNLIDSSIEPMSSLSGEILRRTDLHAINKKRTENLAWMQQALAEGRGGGLITSAMPGAAGAGLAFPVCVHEGHRDPLRDFLRNEGFFCPVHWPIPEKTRLLLGPSAISFASELLSLPIDQRYDALTLEKLLNTIEQYGESCR